MLKKFNSATAFTDEVLICYFCDSLRPSIQAQTDERGQDLDTWKEAIKKAIDIETKTACQPQSPIKEMDNGYPEGHQPTQTDEPAKKPKNTNKNSCKPQKLKNQAFQRFKNADTSKKTWKEKKKNDQKNERDYQAQKGSTPASRVNIKTFGGGNFRRRNWQDPV